MEISQQNLQDKYGAKILRIAFVGMSNIGKTYRSSALAQQYDFARHCVDDLIAEELGLRTEAEMATWLGQPYTKSFYDKQAHYLKIEDELTRSCPLEGNVILDTTGSVIYLDEETLQWIKDNFLVVHLRVQDDMLQEMTDNYFASPKPVVWGESFCKQASEDDTSALRRCYPDLLQHRIQKYTELADIEISGAISRDENINLEEFWQILQKSL